jgi:hypothetical protein
MIARMLRLLALLVTLTGLACVYAQAQQPSTLPQEPKTKLEGFDRQIGKVVIKGHSNVGVVSALGRVSVECMEFTEASSGNKQRGIVVDVSESGRLERNHRSFIDYDEVEPLLKGIDYISKIKGDVTRLESFEAIYKTKGDVSITTFSASTGKIEAAVSSGNIGATTAFLSMGQLQELRNLIVKAKSMSDDIK